MSTARYYVFESDLPWRRIFAREHPPWGKWPAEWHGKRIRIAQAIIENIDRRPVSVLDVRGIYWAFTRTGDVELSNVAELMIDADDRFHLRRNKVPDLARLRAIDERRKARFWDVGPEQTAFIGIDVFGRGKFQLRARP